MRDGRLTKVDSCDGSAVGRGVLDSLWRLVSRGLASLTLGDRLCEFRILRRFLMESCDLPGGSGDRSGEVGVCIVII